MKIDTQITKLQMFTFLIQTQIGVAFLSLPHEIHNYAKGDSWMSLLLTGVFMELFIIFYILLTNRFPKQHLFTILESVLGKIVGRCLTLIYAGYFLLTGTTILVLFVSMLKKWMLIYTPYWVILLLMVSIGIYIATENLQVIARFSFIATIVILTFIVVAPIAFKDGNLHYIMPVGDAGLMNIINGAAHATLAWQGMELFLLIAPFVISTGREKMKVFTLANLFITLFYAFITFTCLIYFSGNELVLLPQPVLYLLKSFSFTIIERPDLVLISFWIILVGTSFISYLYGASMAGAFLFKKWPRRSYVYLSAITCFVAALFFNSVQEITKLTKYVTYTGLIFLMVIPAALLFISFLFQKRQRGEIDVEN
ncbi:spore germination protein [Neobacillus niacini]|uniref:GerAB/ArcD/ProY family transporter n=1 Tax=Neobacillus niacini TaxID=86668 RepID=UPI0021CB1B96|nr:spore germination protein [Neobacillus niacini]MCM3766709.1 spore germination protein [Neobacillus niacini]